VSFLADLLSTVFERRYRSRPGHSPDGRSMEELSHELLSCTGEGSGGQLAGQILDRYAAMNGEEKLGFFRFLNNDLSIEPTRVRNSLTAYESKPSKETYEKFMTAAEPPRQELVRRLNQVVGATGQLVAMREDLLGFLAQNPALAPLDLDIRHLLSSWFNRGFLVLRPINWESPAHILEKIIAYEAVHEIDSWSELRQRLEPGDRRCFAFFHPAMPDEPLIFVEVALTQGIAGSIQSVLTNERETLLAEHADTAVFYSISNCQPGLSGISLGNSLIKQVVADLSLELPGLETFVTLSPIPGLIQWLEHVGIAVDEREKEEELRRLAAHYLLTAKRSDGMPDDPVARFHLGNGAMVYKIHANGDLSKNGMAQSAGTMVNYLYDKSAISRNHEQYASGQTIAASVEVKNLSSAVSTKITEDA